MNTSSIFNKTSSPWMKLPVIVRAIISGVFVTIVGTLPWAWLVSLNIKYLPSVPWSVPIIAVYLWLYWQYFIKGKGWPAFTAQSRKKMARANGLGSDVWGASILSGFLGWGSLLAFSTVLSRLIKLPQQDSSGVEHVPLLSLFIILLGSSAVAGIAEETGFRGYMQKPIEERHGPVVAIIITGIMFGLAHFSHAETTLSLMPFYFFVALIYGMLAYITKSILPGILLHAAGDVFAGFNLFTQGQSEWAPAAPRSLVWENGIDRSFLFSLLIFFIIGSITVWSYIMLKKLMTK